MITYHLTPETYYRSHDPSAPYKPPGFAKDGFIHCTDGIENVLKIANWNFKDSEGSWLVIAIQKQKVQAPIRYEDRERIYPHIYGPLNRDAIVAVVHVPRGKDGTFLHPGASDLPKESGC